MSTTERCLDLRDDRGTTLVMGVAMASFLVGVVWYMTGVGDTIVAHEQLQDAADSAAFRAAVYDAKGMNALAVLNLVMEGILAAIMALRVLQLLFDNGIWLILWSNISPLSQTQGLPYQNEQLAALTAAMMNDVSIQKAAGQALQAVHTASDDVASGMPWVAEYQSLGEAKYYPPTAQSTLTVSVAQDPQLQFTPVVEQPGDGFDAFVSKVGGLKKRVGLPVQDGTFTLLCNQTITDAMPNVLKKLFNYGVDRTGYLQLTQAQMAGITNAAVTFSTALESNGCGDGGDEAASYTAAAAALCGAAQSLWNQCVQQGQVDANGADYWLPGSDVDCSVQLGWPAGAPPSAVGPFDAAGCVSSTAVNLQKEGDTLQNSLNAWLVQQGSPAPKAMYPYATNGNDYTAVWGIAAGNARDIASAGVRVAEWHPGPNAAPEAVTMYSKAEFYYDPQTSSGETWPNLFSTALFNPHWVARLRRFAPPMVGDAAGDFDSFIAGDVASFVDGSPNGSAVGVTAFSKDMANPPGGGQQGQMEQAAGYLH
jgi:hypothetical protein